ncbi:AAA family ATPase [Clostridium neuense]|uniref:AAA family ATPase n=1 Tax=Clostridium neuense TaxID=1728934 RepID=A0ABW8TE77_9CLOT
MGIDFKEKTQRGKLMEFLKNNVARINTIKAESIVKLLADNSLDLLLNDNKYLLNIKGINEKTIVKIKECLQVYIGLKEILQQIKMLDDTELLINEIYKGIGSKAVNELKENPYYICDKCDINFSVADKIALNLGLPFDNKNRIKQGVMCVINNEIEKKGNIFTYKDKIAEELLRFINKTNIYNNKFDDINKMVYDALNSLYIDGKIIIEGDAVYREDYYSIEKNIIDRIKNSLKMNGLCENGDMVLKHEALKNYKLSDEQKEAVVTAITSKISIITGGPGTGKTEIIKVLLSIINVINPKAEVKISAPTGKAAIKISKTTGREATTIHRLLNLFVGDAKKNKVNTINCDFLIIDEASMVDAYLFSQLFTNTNYKTNVVIIGDYNQLPSVGAGSILKDLINSEKVPVVILKKVYRQSKESLIIKNAHRLIDNSQRENNIEFDDKEFIFIDEKDDKIISTLITMIDSLSVNGDYSLNDIMVLSTVNDGMVGVKELNKKIQSWCREDESDGTIKNHDRIIQLENNYNLKVMNGEVGVVNGVTNNVDTGEIRFNVKIDDRSIEYNNDTIKQLQLAYCITVHKSQGSEYPVILIPISKENMYMANLNTIYTAITRAKEKVVLIGDRNAFLQSINRKEEGKRNSKIVEKLRMANKAIS